MESTATDPQALERNLHDPTASPISLPFEFLKHITYNFSSEQELGKGGYGVVYKGILQSGKIIAVKRLFEHLVDDDQFQKEVTNVIGIKHQNIVQLLGYCAESRSEAVKLPNGSHVIAQIPRSLLCFEYLENKSLDKHISDESSGLDWNKRYEIIKGICSGLHCLHGEYHIVHLDLKPENILMDDAMMPKIADFGLSKLLGTQKSRTIISGNFAGSLGYMAPEYLLQGVVSPKADIFSFGVIIIEIITGGKDYPMSIVPSFQQFNEDGSRQSTEISLKKFRENVVMKWRDVVNKEPKHSSPEIYIEQVEQCITTALECLDYDSTRRPTSCEISQMLTRQICGCQKKTTLLSAQPFELRFHFTKYHDTTSCPVQVTNNTDDTVAFRIITNNRDKYFLGPFYGLVLPRSIYTLRVAMYQPHENDNRFTIKLQCTLAGNQFQLPDIKADGSANDYNHFFTAAANKGREVQEVKLLCVVAHDEPGSSLIITRHPSSFVHDINVHPTKTWIITRIGSERTFHIWDYRTQEIVHPSKLSDLCRHIGSAIFIPRQQWFVAGSLYGCIQVYSYEMTQEVKTYLAHVNSSINSLDVHPSEPYVLSASKQGGTVKLWNWENGWECVRTFDTAALQVKFNPKDADYFACATRSGVKIWNIASPGSDGLTTIDTSHVSCLDYLTLDDEVYLVTGHAHGAVKIWYWQSLSCFKILQGHGSFVSTVCAHPNLRIVITGSWDGSVCLWNSFEQPTPMLQGKLNCGLGRVNTIACLNGSNRIAIGHAHGLAITKI